MRTLSDMDITWIQPYYHKILEYVPRGTKTVLDVGAGYGIFGYILKKTRNLERLDAIEPFYDDLTHYDNVVKATWKNTVLDIFYDVIVATEVIEHMERDDALEFLDDVRNYGKKIIIATPKNFESQKEYDGNPYQSHKCVVTRDDFESKGYSVFELENNIIGVR